MAKVLTLILCAVGTISSSHFSKRADAIPQPNNTEKSLPPPAPVTTVVLKDNPGSILPVSKSLNWSDPCAPLPVEPATWNRLKLDNYLATLPEGKNITLLDFSIMSGVQNFICGIGETCNAGQPCSPIPGPTWQVFYAIQNWNLVENTVYSAIALGVSMTQSITSALVSDLYHPRKRSPLWKWNDIFSIAAAVAALAASVVLIWPGTLLAIGILYSINAIIDTGEGVVGLKLLQLNKKDRPDPFERWSEFSWYLQKWQSIAQRTLADRMMDIMNAGVSTPQGISSVLSNGTYFRHIETRQFHEVESQVSFTATARVLGAIIRDYGGFVTIGNGCHGKGPNGAWEDPNSISFCYPNKTMMNVIRQKDGKAVNTWYHGSVINSTYGFTAEYIATQSYNCQMKYGKPENNLYNMSAIPTDRNSDCVFNLPVCDTRIHAVHKAIKKHGTVYAFILITQISTMIFQLSAPTARDNSYNLHEASV
ncbi:hypothetical protein O181_050725 [Austropuccinia psidii MF-1]|uniref:DUF7872 domain-containing protein n=1 Tax=Austropuccinia psidii MF-1 TaxID=1389203 RepID=A0A9Q3E1M2_9BASI|nr:hypothetical protein [Austropuccinia psidii MF-1]